MRYFVNTSAAKPIVLGGIEFSFELVGLRGGSWLGILAVEESAASILATSTNPNVGETTFENYEKLKKKFSANQGNSPAWPKQTSTNPSLTVAEVAENRTAPRVSNPNSTAAITAVSLLTTTNQPPIEPLLVMGGRQRRPV